MKILMLGPIVLAAVAFSVLPHAATAQAQTQMEGKPHRDMQKMHDEMHSRRGKAHHPGAEMKDASGSRQRAATITLGSRRI
jgi:hypothetical protein